ncbi:hypothetical protein [Dactylosporangium maewongense]|uniref:hypothetical protein n=1 Tax=Dactylosporangium maewongense TaxID=634393 RepID=UPI0031E35A7C
MGVVVHHQPMAEGELLLEVGIEPEYSQIRLSVTGGDCSVPEWGGGPHTAVSGPGMMLVATWSDDCGPVTVRVYDGRPVLDGWSLVHAGRLEVGPAGLDAGMTVSAVEHWVPVPEGLVEVEVWVRDPAGPGEVTFVLTR